MRSCNKREHLAKTGNQKIAKDLERGIIELSDCVMLVDYTCKLPKAVLLR